MVLDYYESPLKRRYKAVLTKPHQPFFLLGMSIALFSIAALGLAIKGVFDIDIRLFHIFNMAILMPTALFLGFLTTVLYRFLLVTPFLQKEYMQIFWVLLAGVAVAQIGFFVSNTILLVGILLVFAAQSLAMKMFTNAYKKSTIADKREIFWFLFAFNAGVLSSLVFAASIFYPPLTSLATNLAFYPFAVGVVFAVAQKMVPNFFILYFGIMEPQKNKSLLPIILISLSAIAIFGAFNFSVLALCANIIGTGTTLVLFYDNRFIFRRAPTVLWVLQIGALWFLAGFASGIAVGISDLLHMGVVPSLLQAHIFGVGFIITMAIGFGSRVAMGHSGRKIAADKLSAIIFASLVLLTVIRLIGVYSPVFLDGSIHLWCLIFGVWIYKYAPMLTSD